MTGSGEMVKGLSPKERQRIVLVAIALVGLLSLVAVIYVWRTKHTRPALGTNGSPETSSSKSDDPYRIAVQKVEQDRGEPVGNKAKIKVPPELKLYKDRDRFLAIQVAESLEQKYEIPRDFTGLAPMVERGEFERLPVLGNGYILYGVGLRAQEDEFTYFDEKAGKSIPLFESEAALEKEMNILGDSLKDSETKIQELKKDLSKVQKEDRQARQNLQKQISETQKAAEQTKMRRELIDSFYKSEEHRRLMVEEYGKLSELARNFDGRSFNLNDASSRKELKVSLLSMLRPQARARLEEIAMAYRQKFDRPLPVTSLLRTREYQKYLGESGNPNAIAIATPPHTTGLAFDIYTYYMTAAEQEFLMDEIARLKREMKVEALRENRDHIHVFAFADGRRPDESLIKNAFKMSQGK
jgi:hypothetical protein